MTDEQIKQNAEQYAEEHMVRTDGGGWEEEYDYEEQKAAYIAGAHSRNDEIEHKNTAIKELGKVCGDLLVENLNLKTDLYKLQNPWISVKDRLPEEEVNNISIPVAAITNEGYWFKGQYDYDNKEWFFSEDPDHLDFEAGEFVTYWMPIPELKKK